MFDGLYTSVWYFGGLKRFRGFGDCSHCFKFLMVFDCVLFGSLMFTIGILMDVDGFQWFSSHVFINCLIAFSLFSLFSSCVFYAFKQWSGSGCFLVGFEHVVLFESLVSFVIVFYPLSLFAPCYF